MIDLIEICTLSRVMSQQNWKSDATETAKINLEAAQSRFYLLRHKPPGCRYFLVHTTVKAGA